MLRLIPGIFIDRKDIQRHSPSEKKNGSDIAKSDFEKAEEFSGQFADVFTKTVHYQVPLLDRSAPFIKNCCYKERGSKLLKGLNTS